MKGKSMATVPALRYALGFIRCVLAGRVMEHVWPECNGNDDCRHGGPYTGSPEAATSVSWKRARQATRFRDRVLPVIELTFLGTGTSTGVPVIGCDCEVCTSTDPRDARLRSSVLVRTREATILIDTSPDLRAQMLATRPDRIDAVLYTHAHADHTAGLDELRRFNVMQDARIPVWATRETANDLEKRFSYAFDHTFSFFGGKPDLDLHLIDSAAPFVAAGVEITPIPINHGRMPIIGYRIGGFVYVTDVKTIPEDSRPLMENADLLVVTALRQKEHVAHMNLAEAMETIERHQPKRALLTHLAHDMGRYADVAPGLPKHVAIATDGMTVTLDR